MCRSIHLENRFNSLIGNQACAAENRTVLDSLCFCVFNRICFGTCSCQNHRSFHAYCQRAAAQSVREVEALLAYHDQPEEALDYSVIGGFAPVEAGGKCVYCNHCQPCPMGLDIALINKYYDLARAGDGMAAEHYAKLDKVAGDCVGCGHCDQRCPFHVAQSERMREIAGYFGK